MSDREEGPYESAAQPRLADVADVAGVSTATVSRALNQPGTVTPQLRERVMAAVDALGYVPHGPARALASRRSYTVGAVVPTIDNAIFARNIQARPTSKRKITTCER